MYLYAVAGSKTAKITALFTLFAVIISLFPVSVFAHETGEAHEEPSETSSVIIDVCSNIPEAQLEVPKGMELNAETGECTEIPEEPVCVDDSAKNYNEVGECEYEDIAEPSEECEVEGHKYDESGNPLSGWVIGLMKTITHNNGEDAYDLATDITNEDGYFCLEWDGETRIIREGTESSYIDGAYTFIYRVFEKMKAGWENVSIEKGPDYLDLDVATEGEIDTDGEYVSVQISEEGGYIYADAAYHVDFYNTEIDPCNENRDDMIKVAKISEDPCDEDKVTIYGYKFNDKNGDGDWDTETEFGIEGWEINLEHGDDAVLHATTDEDGYYEFEIDDNDGTYRVTETNQKGWEQTALIGENADGDTCYINVGQIAAKSKSVDNIQIPEPVIEDNTCTFGNHEDIVAPVCAVGNNLLVNGSFEDPIVTSPNNWDIFSTVAGWTIAMSNGLELWANGFYGGASDGNQNAELDGNSPTKITQSVVTTPGATYELRFDFSARPGASGVVDNNVDGLVNGLAIMNAVTDGSDIGENTWSTHAQTFVATGASTEIGLVDKGEDNSYGSLVDNAILCLVSNPGDGDDDDTPNRGGRGGSKKKTPTGEVLGAQATTPTGLVLGEATSTLPMGAPNTGAGGTSPLVVQLPSIVAVLPKTQKIK